jgi:hypothetical protein
MNESNCLGNLLFYHANTSFRNQASVNSLNSVRETSDEEIAVPIHGQTTETRSLIYKKRCLSCLSSRFLGSAKVISVAERFGGFERLMSFADLRNQSRNHRGG